MLPFICELADKKSYSIYLLGGKPGVADKMKKNLEGKYSKLRIVGTRDGYFDRVKDNSSVVKKINESNADILLVAFGAPMQGKMDRRKQLPDKCKCSNGCRWTF